MEQVSVKAFSKCKAYVKNLATEERFKVDFVIVDKDLSLLLSGNTVQGMGLIKVNYDNFKVVNTFPLLIAITFSSFLMHSRTHQVPSLARRSTNNY